VNPRASLDDMEKRKLLTLPGLKLQPVASHYTDYAIPAPQNPSYLHIYILTLSMTTEVATGYASTVYYCYYYYYYYYLMIVKTETHVY
jgi:hypothetical protein